MNLEIITKSQVRFIVDSEIRRCESRVLGVIDRVRKRVAELERQLQEWKDTCCFGNSMRDQRIKKLEGLFKHEKSMYYPQSHDEKNILKYPLDPKFPADRVNYSDAKLTVETLIKGINRHLEGRG